MVRAGPSRRPDHRLRRTRAQPPERGERRPNVLFIMTDEQRSDGFGEVGNPQIRLEADLEEFVNRWDDAGYAEVKGALMRGLVDLLVEAQGRWPPRLVLN
jgi:hypothetical protein